jgi:hypothetical protein
MTRFGEGVALVAGLLTAGVILAAGTTPALAAVAGTVALLVGVRRAWDTGTNLGGFLLLGAVVYAGALGLAPQALVVATIGAVLAWDGAVTAAGLEEQLDAAATSRRAELVHTGSTLVAAAGVGAVVVLTFTVGRGLVTPAAAIPVAAGAVLVAAGLSPRTPG